MIKNKAFSDSWFNAKFSFHFTDKYLAILGGESSTIAHHLALFFTVCFDLGVVMGPEGGGGGRNLVISTASTVKIIPPTQQKKQPG